jgi:hypothetical protein
MGAARFELDRALLIAEDKALIGGANLRALLGLAEPQSWSELEAGVSGGR